LIFPLPPRLRLQVFRILYGQFGSD
jgi:hypothetical protein